MMKKLFSRVIVLSMILFSYSSMAQTVHYVDAGSYYYSPQVLEIVTGDIVTWTNVGGTHDVNFDISTLTGESFGNPDNTSLPTNTGGELGSITFNTAGTYNYDCSNGQHAANGMTGTIIVSQAAGFYPPAGSTFNEDSTVITLPGAVAGAAYDETISFYASNEINMPLGEDVVGLTFISAEILSVDTPEGMSTSCEPGDCIFGPEAWGEVSLTGTPMYGGTYNLNLSAMVTLNLTNIGIPSDLTFPIPYNGENAVLNMAVGGDYSAVNSFIPNFVLEVEGEQQVIEGCTDATATNYNAAATVDDGSCEYASTGEGVRYVDEIFSDVIVSSNVMYGSNIGIISQAPAQEDLYMDIYEPAGDSEINRPVVVMLHTGSFLPAIVNGQATGDKSDNSIVEMCTRFAKKGYVAVAINYRLGWNPVSTSEDVRRSTLIQAAYRGLQDTKTAVRFLRKSAAEDGNPYGVGDQFAVGGHGTGGYLSLAMATLNDYETELLMPKFIDTSEETIATYGQPMPYIIPSIMGNFEATDYGMMPFDSDGDGIPDMEIPLCIPNHVGYSSEVDMVFNAGGALPDISWLEEGEVPIASMQNIADPDAPYAEGNVIVPTTGEFVIVAHGSQLVQENATAYGNNDVFNGLSTSVNDAWYSNGDAAANAAVAGHDDLPGLFGMITPEPSATPTACGFQTVQNAPWDWWDNDTYGAMADGYHGTPAGTMGCLALLGNPDMSAEKGAAMCDMMDEFFSPRIHAALSIEGNNNTEGPSEQTLNLVSGWSMFSTYMMTDNMAMDVVLEPIVDQVIIAKNYLGAAYLPEWGFNGIGDVLIGQGYQIKTSEAVDLTISGTYMSPEENPIDLVAGWNMIGYLRLEPALADLALADLVDAGNLIIAKDYLGAAFLPEWGFNGIGDLKPGNGYQIKTNTAGTLSYLSNDESYRLAALPVTSTNTDHNPNPLNTGSNMTITIDKDAWNVMPQVGDEISVYNSKGELVGATVYTNPVTVISVWGDDETTEKVDGMNSNESMTFKLWSKRYNLTQELIVKEWIEGSNAYQTNALYHIGSIDCIESTSAINQFGLYPIPAKQELNVDIHASLNETITVDVYNLIGELVSTNNHDLNKGMNTIQLNIESLNEGAYLCKVNSSQGVLTRKFNVIK